MMLCFYYTVVIVIFVCSKVSYGIVLVPISESLKIYPGKLCTFLLLEYLSTVLGFRFCVYSFFLDLATWTYGDRLMIYV